MPGSIPRRNATFVLFWLSGERRGSKLPSGATRTSVFGVGPGWIEPDQFFVSTTKSPKGVTTKWSTSAVGNALPGA